MARALTAHGLRVAAGRWTVVRACAPRNALLVEVTRAAVTTRVLVARLAVGRARALLGGACAVVNGDLAALVTCRAPQKTLVGVLAAIGAADRIFGGRTLARTLAAAFFAARAVLAVHVRAEVARAAADHSHVFGAVACLHVQLALVRVSLSVRAADGIRLCGCAVGGTHAALVNTLGVEAADGATARGRSTAQAWRELQTT